MPEISNAPPTFGSVADRLSSGQAAMWISSRFRNHGTYVEQVVVEFRAPHDAAALESAWAETVAAVPALRVLIGESEDGGLVARVLEAVVGGWENHAGAFENLPWLESDRLAPFPEDRPAWRCAYWPADGVLVWTIHHALMDGRSMGAVVGHFLKRVAGVNPDPAPRWQGCLAADAAENEGARKALAGRDGGHEEEPFTWDGDAARTDGVPWRIRMPLPEETSARLEERARELGTTSHGLVQWAWAWAVARIAGRENITLGVVRSAHWVFGKEVPSAGYLMNTVPVPARADAAASLGDALRSYRDAVLAVRDFPKAEPREFAAGLGRPASQPWDAVVMTEKDSLAGLILAEAPAGILQNVELHERTGEPLTASAWLGRDPEIEIEAAPDKFSHDAARVLLDTWQRAIALAVSSPAEAVLSQLDPLPPEVLEKIAADECGGPASAPDGVGIWQAFAAVAARHPDRTAMKSGGDACTYAELLEEAEKLAAALASAGTTAGDRVASRIDDRRFAPLVVLACARLAAVYMPFDADIPPERVQRMLEVAQPKVMVRDADEDAPAGLARVDPRELADTASPLPPFAPHDPYLPFCLLFTSGSTGEPKGVINHHHGILNEVLAVGKLLEFTPDDHVMQFASLGFDAALEEILGALMAGATLVPREERILESFDTYQDFLTENSVSIADLPTAYWAGWCAWLDANHRRPPECVRAVIIGGEKAGAASADAWKRACEGAIPVYNTYGPTETAIVATTALLVIPEDGGDPPIGRPLPGLKARIVDAAGKVCPPGRPGELWLGGAGVGLGYWQRPEATAAVFVPGEIEGRPAWYRTGDVARMDDAGTLHFMGRIDDQVKIRGKRIEPDEIKARLEVHPEVRQAHVGAPLIDGRRQIIAWVVGSVSEEALGVFLRKDLPSWMVPAAFVFLEELPLNARGKVDRKKLPVPEVKAEEEGGEGDDPLEKWMASLFAEVLKVDPASIRMTADFAEQGGDSISSMVLATRLRKAGVEMEPGELATASSPRRLAERIKQGYGKARTEWEPLVQLRAGDPKNPPLVLIHATPGDVLGYANLATELDPALPCIGVVSRGLHVPDQAHQSIEEMAAAYIEVLRPRLGEGRWLLGGWCYGGIVAYEMARQLVDAGFPEPYLVMIEAWAQSPADAGQRKKLKLAKQTALIKMPLAGKVAFLKSRFFPTDAHPAMPDGHDDGFTRSVIYRANMDAIEKYEPKPYSGKLHVLIADDHEDGTLVLPCLGWNLLGASCECHAIRGGHDLALRPPNAANLAKLLGKLLENERTK